MKRLRSTAQDPQVLHLQHLPLECTKEKNPYAKDCDRKLAEPFSWEDCYLKHDDLKILPRSQDVFRKIELDPRLSLLLPKPGANAGRVLEHATKTFEALLSKHKPMTFKFGFTHDAAVRWHCDAFGYKYSREPFEFMVVIYAASNALGPAFLEAALIDRFGSY